MPGRVGVICGGGSGHEPAFAGYVGDGMLHASIAGSVFASPPSTQILAAILALAEHNPSGIVVVVFNYTGDRYSSQVFSRQFKTATLTGIWFKGCRLPIWQNSYLETWKHLCTSKHFILNLFRPESISAWL